MCLEVFTMVWKHNFEKVQLLSFFYPLNCASNKPSNFKHFPNNLWCRNLKVFCKSITLISLLHPKGTFSNANLHNYSKQKWINLLCNVKTRWIFVFSPTKGYCKVHVLGCQNEWWSPCHQSYENYSYVMLKLSHASLASCQCWKVMHELIKFVQSCETFVCDFMGVVMMFCMDLYTFYYDI